MGRTTNHQQHQKEHLDEIRDSKAYQSIAEYETKMFLKKIVLATLIFSIPPAVLIALYKFLLPTNVEGASVGVPYYTNSQLNQTIFEEDHKIIDFVKKDCEALLNTIAPGTVIGIDGSWDHRRNGKHCIVEAMDTKTNYIIAYEIAVRNNSKNSEEVNYIGPANGMERAATKKLIEKLKDNTLITGFVHDKDAKTSKDFKELWNITEFIDPGHAIKAFKRSFTSANSGKKKNIAKGSLTGLEYPLTNFLSMLIYDYSNNFSIPERLFFWENAVNHFNGDHRFCLHQNYTSKEKEKKQLTKWANKITDSKNKSLSQFLLNTEKYLINVDTKYRTQGNEAFHALKAQILNKNVAWGRTFEARMAIAVLRWNHPDNYIEMLATAVGMPRIGKELQSLMSVELKEKQYIKEWKKVHHLQINKQKIQQIIECQKDYQENSEYRMQKC